MRSAARLKLSARSATSSRPFDLDPGAQVSATQGFDPLLETFEASGNAPGDRIGPDAQAHREQRHSRQPAQPPARTPATRVAGYEPAAVGQREHHRTPVPTPVQEAAMPHVRGWGRQAVRGGREQGSIGVEEGELRLEVGCEFHQGTLDFRFVRTGRGQQAHRQYSRPLEVARVFVASPVQVPPDRHQHREHREDADEGEVDAEVEPRLSHPGSLASM